VCPGTPPGQREPLVAVFSAVLFFIVQAWGLVLPASPKGARGELSGRPLYLRGLELLEPG